MRTPVAALLWECWRLSRQELLLRMVGVVFAIIALQLGSLDQSQRAILPIAVMPLLAVNCLFSFAWTGGLESASGFVFSLGFARPAKTQTLVLVPLAFVTVMTWITFAVPAWLIGCLQGIHMPVLAPASALVLATTIMTMISWTITNRFLRILALGTGGIALFAAPIMMMSLANSDKILTSVAAGEFFRLGAWFHLMVFVAISVASWVTVQAVERQRHGEFFSFSLPGSFGRKSSPESARLASGFSRPFTALLWLEWKRFGARVLQTAVAVAIAAIILFVAIHYWLPEDQRGGRIAFCAMFIAGLSPLVLQIIACESAIGLKYRQGIARMSLFELARPVTNESMLTAKLVVVAATSLLGWLGVLATTVFAVWLEMDSDSFSQVVAKISELWQATGWHWIGLIAIRLAMLFVYTSAVSMTLGFLLSRYTGKFTIATTCFFAVALAMIWDSGNGWRFQTLWLWLGVALAIAQSLASLWFIRKSIVTRAIGRGSLIVVVGLWLGSMYLDWTIWQMVSAEYPVRIASHVFVSALLSQLIPLAVILSLPLALGIHRHQ